MENRAQIIETQRGLDILKNSAILSGLNIGGKGLGMVRDIVVAARFGTGWQMDAFLLSLSICEVIYNAFTTPIRITVIPWITKQMRQEDLPDVWKEIFTLLKKLQEEKKTTFVVVTHNEELKKYADRVASMKDGEITSIN